MSVRHGVGRWSCDSAPRAEDRDWQSLGTAAEVAAPPATPRRRHRPYHVAVPAQDRPPVTGFVVVIVAASLFGTLGPLSRFAYDAGMEPLPFVVWRGLIGFAGAAVFVAWRIRRGNMHLTRLSDLDRGARITAIAWAAGTFW